MNNYFFKVADRVTYIILHIQKGPLMFFLSEVQIPSET